VGCGLTLDEVVGGLAEHLGHLGGTLGGDLEVLERRHGGVGDATTDARVLEAWSGGANERVSDDELKKEQKGDEEDEGEEKEGVPVSEKEPERDRYQGVSASAFLARSTLSRISKPACLRASASCDGFSRSGRPLPTSIPATQQHKKKKTRKKKVST
jgi:hypothetical protein